MKLALVPAGSFWMGSPATEAQRSTDEGPRTKVLLSRPFYLGAYEVTQEEYRRVMGTNPSFFSPTGPGKDRVAGLNTARFPVEQVWVRLSKPGAPIPHAVFSRVAVEITRRRSAGDGV